MCCFLTEERGKVAEDEGEIDVEEVDQLVGMANAWEKMQRQVIVFMTIFESLSSFIKYRLIECYPGICSIPNVLKRTLNLSGTISKDESEKVHCFSPLD